MTAAVNAGEFEPYAPPGIYYDIKNADVTVKYPKGEDSGTVFCNGRICVPIKKGAELMGAEFTDNGGSYRIKLNGKSKLFYVSKDSNRPVVFTYNNTAYISLYELVTPFDYTLTANLSAGTLELVKSECAVSNMAPAAASSQKAYIRLEDITADGLKPAGDGSYTADMLEKLKYTAEYLYLRGQHYYVAWIPVYADPAENYWNDVSKDYSLYNSYFLYVMDYMADHNGHIGLHGYTHQYGNDESGFGWEWGANTPFNFNEQQRRMRAAKECADKLGYKAEFFEFPHYDATDRQLKMAEYYFDMICQSYPSAQLANKLTYTTRSGKKVWYLPTPADHVHFRRDYAIFDRLESSFNNGYTISLFYHPVLDIYNLEVANKDGKRVWSYNEDGTLPSLVDYITKRGYAFSSVG